MSLEIARVDKVSLIYIVCTEAKIVIISKVGLS